MGDCGEARSLPCTSADITQEINALAEFKAPCVSAAVKKAARGGTSFGRIRRVSEETAAALSSHQVITDLRSICKELVENAIDAGATSVEVRLIDCGLGGLEVSDNGSGIAARNFDSLGCRHATSKIQAFEDVYSKLNSLGFRGEALASLCVVARLSIITRAASDSFATRLVFDHHGRQIGREAAAREVGTTVCVNDIFARLPLRRKAMEQTKSRQLQDALALLQRIALQYATVCRIVLSNLDPRAGCRNTLLTTKGTSTNLLEAALSVYGSKQLAACAELTLEGRTPGREWKLEAVISRPPYGLRSTSLQHFYVRRRAVDFPPLLQKLLNAKWKEVSSRGLFPVCIAFLEVDASLVDVNIRKDKQDVMLNVERDIAHALLNSVTDLLAPNVTSFQPGRKSSSTASCTVGTTDTRLVKESKSLPSGVSYAPNGSPSARNDTSNQDSDVGEELVTEGEPRSSTFGSRNSSSCDKMGDGYGESSVFTDTSPALSIDVANASKVNVNRDKTTLDGELKSRELFPSDTTGESERPLFGAREVFLCNTKPSMCISSPTLSSAYSEGATVHRTLAITSGFFQRTLAERSKVTDIQNDCGLKAVASVELQKSQYSCPLRDPPFLVDNGNIGIQHEPSCRQVSPKNTDLCDMGEEFNKISERCCGPKKSAQNRCDFEAELVADAVLRTAVADFSPKSSLVCQARRRRRLSYVSSLGKQHIQQSTASCDNSALTPSLSLPRDLMTCEGMLEGHSQLTKTSAFLFHKRRFRDLLLVGQFNKGFIIAALRNFRSSQMALGNLAAEGVSVGGSIRQTKMCPPCSNLDPANPSEMSTTRCRHAQFSESELSLFIIDQHASDEKRIFEELNASFNFKMQHLLVPHKVVLPAELVAAAEAFWPILRSNGFVCTISRDCPTTFASKQKGTRCGNARMETSEQQFKAPSAGCAGDKLGRAENPIDTGHALISNDNADWDRCGASAVGVGKEYEYDMGGECRCWLSAVPVVQGRQLSVTDFTEFLGALASEDQGRAAWNGTLPPASHCARLLAAESSTAVDTVITKEAVPCTHHRVLQYRPARVWNILASKACRSAVKIGDSLAPSRLLAILRRMAELQLPFNCPHGRPTMRHLADVKPPNNKIAAKARSVPDGSKWPQTNALASLLDNAVECKVNRTISTHQREYATECPDKRRRLSEIGA